MEKSKDLSSVEGGEQSGFPVQGLGTGVRVSERTFEDLRVEDPGGQLSS